LTRYIIEMNERRLIRADDLGKILMVTDAERTRLRFTTIGACDVSKAERTRRRKQRNRRAQEARRRARGATPRAQYLQAAIARQQPWIAEGVSRRTWYRRQKSAFKKSVAQVRVQQAY
jgi:hypothetical protein